MAGKILSAEAAAKIRTGLQGALQLARKHNETVRSRERLKVREALPLRHAMEIRHQSFAVPEFIRLLRRQKIALVCADSVEWPRLMDLTTDFAYLRLHGSEQLYASGY